MSADNCCDTALQVQDNFEDLQRHLNDTVKHTSLELASLQSQVNHLKKSVEFERKRAQQQINYNQRLKRRVFNLERKISKLENPPEPSSSSSSEEEQQEEEQQEEEQDGDLSDNSVAVPPVVAVPAVVRS